MSKLFFEFWLRRLMEIGGAAGTVLGGVLFLWNLIPEPSQAFFLSLLSRRWQEVNLGEIVTYAWPAVFAVWGVIWSKKSTSFAPDEPVANKRQPGLLKQIFGKRAK